MAQRIPPIIIEKIHELVGVGITEISEVKKSLCYKRTLLTSCSKQRCQSLLSNYT